MRSCSNTSQLFCVKRRLTHNSVTSKVDANDMVLLEPFLIRSGLRRGGHCLKTSIPNAMISVCAVFRFVVCAFCQPSVTV